jgi:hypothetical protein
MRTTVELPPDLMRAAKARSAERGESLKSLLTRAVEAELQAVASRTRPAFRVALPLFGNAQQPAVRISNADLERALAEADRVSTGRPGRRPGRGRTRR